MADKIKMVVLGDTNAGKTTLVNSFVKHSNDLGAAPTIGAGFSSQVINTQNGDLRLELWDVAGQEKYRALWPMYYRQAQVIMFCFALDSKKQFEQLPRMIDTVRQANDTAILAIVGTKKDRGDAVSSEQGLDLALKYNAVYCENSVADNFYIQQTFKDAIKHLAESNSDFNEYIPI